MPKVPQSIQDLDCIQFLRSEKEEILLKSPACQVSAMATQHAQLMSYFADFVEPFKASKLGIEITAEAQDFDWSLRNARSDGSMH